MVYDGIRNRLLIGCVEDVAQVVQMYNLKRKCGVRDMCGVFSMLGLVICLSDMGVYQVMSGLRKVDTKGVDSGVVKNF